MRSANAPTDFLLPDQPNAGALDAETSAITHTKYVVVDIEGEVRGGFLLMAQPGWLGGREVSVANYQAPLSEGIYDKRFSVVGMQMLRYVQKTWPRTFVVGMGNADRPLPRLLSAAGWKVTAVPWLFRMARPARVIRQLPMLRNRRWLSAAAQLSAGSGIAWLGAQVIHSRRWQARVAARRFALEQTQAWGSWADDLWRRTRDSLAFAVARDRRTLECLYPAPDGRYLIYMLREGSEVVAWAACVNTQMQGHQHFGDLRVATILDAGGLSHAMPALASTVADALTAAGADLVMTNQSLDYAVEAFRRAGFLAGPSNYLFAASPEVAASIGTRTGNVHITRGDGDGRIHL